MAVDSDARCPFCGHRVDHHLSTGCSHAFTIGGVQHICECESSPGSLRKRVTNDPPHRNQARGGRGTVSYAFTDLVLNTSEGG